MIILDLETSGLDTGKCGIWQIGALEFENPTNYFLQEGRIDNEDEVVETALELTGKTESELRDKNKQTQKQLISNFLYWAKTCKEKICAGQNVDFDRTFIQNKCIRYSIVDELLETVGKRTIDLHTVANLAYKNEYGSFKLKEGKSAMNLAATLEFCGLKDERKQVDDNDKVSKQGKTHNALEDIRLEAECFSRLLYGKPLLKEFEKFPIPEYLSKNQGVQKNLGSLK